MTRIRIRNVASSLATSLIPILLISCNAQSPENVDLDRLSQATLVIRSSLATIGTGSKYYWQELTVKSVIKSPANYVVPEKIKVAHLAYMAEVPSGECTVYLMPHFARRGSAKKSWMLLGYGAEVGVSHTAREESVSRE